MKYAILLLVLVLCSCDVQQEKISPRFNHVMLYVSDLDASIEFYSAAFELVLMKKVDTLRVKQEDNSFVSNPVQMAFMKFPGQNFQLELAESKPEAVGDLHFQHLGIDVSDIESSLEKAVRAGAQSNRPIRTVKADAIVAKNTFLIGPDGESIELMQILEGEF